MLRIKKKEIVYREFVSQSIPDVPVCYRPLCFSVSLPVNGMLLIERGIQGHRNKNKILKTPLPLGLSSFYLP